MVSVMICLWYNNKLVLLWQRDNQDDRCNLGLIFFFDLIIWIWFEWRNPIFIWGAVVFNIFKDGLEMNEWIKKKLKINQENLLYLFCHLWLFFFVNVQCSCLNMPVKAIQTVIKSFHCLCCHAWLYRVAENFCLWSWDM